MRSSSGSATNRPVPAAEALAAEPDGPLSADEIDALFAPFAAASKLALAVSGGPDSLALLEAASHWRGGRRFPELLVLTVDHRLRPGSDAVAADVARAAQARGLDVQVLVRAGDVPSANVEAVAREARYRLLIDAARQAGATHLVTAHHRDDVAETFLMRMKRGAGIFGLAAMRPLIDLGDIVVARPFLPVPRARLVATTLASGLVPDDDPMNRDPRFARTAVRTLLATGAVAPAVVAAVAVRMAAVADAVDAEADAFLARHVTADGFGVARVSAAAFAAAPGEVRARVLVRILLAVGGDSYPPRGERLAALLAGMVDPPVGAPRLKRTLSGAVVERRGDAFVVWRESRAEPAAVSLPPGSTAIWDGRFAVSAGTGAPAGLVVGALGEAGRRSVGANGGANGTAGGGVVPSGAFRTLPAVRDGTEIVATPHFREGRAPFSIAFRPLLPERLARPPLFPDFTAT